MKVQVYYAEPCDNRDIARIFDRNGQMLCDIPLSDLTTDVLKKALKSVRIRLRGPLQDYAWGKEGNARFI